jgi:hypothetical protein
MSEVHRPLVVADPPIGGPDVAALQRAMHASGILTPLHGRFTVATVLACVEAQYWLGLLPETYQRRDANGNRLVTEQAQRAIRDPDGRSADQLERATDRRGQLDIGTTFYDKLRRELGLTGNGVEATLLFAATQVGVRERPAGSNDGAWVAAWSRAAGYRDPVPWAGCFANACLMAGGLPTSAAWIGYPPAVHARAKAGEGGWSLHREGQPGDLALSVDGGAADMVAHVEIVYERLPDGYYATIAGNSGANGDRQVDGGIVVRRDDRSTGGAVPIVGFARPPWDIHA